MEMMERNRKLRLLVTTDCPNHCPLCCNNSWDFDKLPVVRDFDYDEVMITGGEPLLFPEKVAELAKAIKVTNKVLYPDKNTKVYIYTSVASYLHLKHILPTVDGVVLTPHSLEDVRKFLNLNRLLGLYFRVNKNVHPSLRLNLFKNIKEMLPEDIDLSLWKVKDMEWIKDCPVPKGEDFRRLPELWHKP